MGSNVHFRMYMSIPTYTETQRIVNGSAEALSLRVCLVDWVYRESLSLLIRVDLS
jgi:hypothetical protein